MRWIAVKALVQTGLLTAAIGFAQTAAPPAPAQTKQVQMAAAQARLDKKVDAKNAKVGDPVTAKLMDDVRCSDGVLLPRDATLSGRVVEVQPSQNKSDSTLVLIFDQLIVKGKPPVQVKVTLLGLASPPVQGPDTTNGNRAMDQQGIPTAQGAGRNGPMGNIPNAPQQPSHMSGGEKDSTVPGVELKAEITDPDSCTLTSKGKNVQLPTWTQLKIAIIDLPPNAVIK
jgi:hypothetical protein